MSTITHAKRECSSVELPEQVYGTKNLRVADISTVPLHVAAHTQAMAYGIGEKSKNFVMIIQS